MKASLEFTLPEEKEEYVTVCKAGEYAAVVSDMYQWLRNAVKYNSDIYSEEQLKTLDEVRDTLIAFMSDHGIEI